MSDSDQNSRQLDEKLFELQALFEISKTLNSSLQLKPILDTLLLSTMGRMLINKGMVLIARGISGAFEIQTLKGLPKVLIGQKIQIETFPSYPSSISQLPPDPARAFFEKYEIALLIPIVHNEKKLGMLCFGKKINNKGFDDSEIEFLNSLANIAATSIQNALMFQEINTINRQLDKKIQELNTLFEIGKELNSTLEKEKIANVLAYSIMGEMTVNRCCIFLKKEEAFELLVNKGFRKEYEEALVKDIKLLDHFKNLCEPLLVHAIEDEGLSTKLANMTVHALIPMQIQNETKGLICIGEKINKFEFTREELEFLTTLGNLSMISIENARLFEETLEKQRMEEELQIAREIQQRLLPRECPKIDNYEIAAINIPSRQVGGDYYDCIKIDDTHFGFCIADVSGKGVPAALLMSNIQASLHALVHTPLSREEMVQKINNLIYQNTAVDKFITFFYGELNLENNLFTSINSGHNPPYIFHQDGTFKKLNEGGLLLGMMPNMPYKGEENKILPGDCIVMFTDGVSEAMNLNDEEFEDHRIEQCVRENLNKSAHEILDALIKAVNDFTAGCPQYDDITLLLIKRLA